MTDPLLSVRELEKHYPVTKGILGREVARTRAVDGVSFDVQRGEAFGVVGESGCGKSTLARTVLRLEEPTSGTVLFDGEDITGYENGELRRFRRRAQMIFQDPDSSFDPRMSVGDSIEEPLRVQGMKDANRRRSIAADLLERVGLSAEDADRYPHELSGGQKQRVAIARALSVNPDLLVADEPVSALDVSTQASVLDLLGSLRDEYGLGVIVITHDISVVETVCDRMGVMYLGEMVEKGDADDVLGEPAHPYTRALLASVPSPDPTAEPPSSSLSGDVPSPQNPPSGCRFHTRCPEIITEDAYGVTPEFLTAVLRLKRSLQDEPDRIVEAVENAEEPRDGLGVPEGDDPRAEGVLRDVADGIADGADGATEDAVSVLEDEFPTPCEEEKPGTLEPEQPETEGTRTVDCHLHDERFSGR